MCSKAPQSGTAALRAAQARCLHSSSGEIEISSSAVNAAPLSSSMSHNEPPSPRASPRAGARSREGELISSSMSQKTSTLHSSTHAGAAPGAARPRGDGAEVGAVAEVDTDADAAPRRLRTRPLPCPCGRARRTSPSAWRPVSGRNRGCTRAMPHGPVRSSRSSVLDRWTHAK